MQANIFELAPPPSLEEDSFNQFSAVGSASCEGDSAPANASFTAASDGLSGGDEFCGQTNFDCLFEAAVSITMATPFDTAATTTTAAPSRREGARSSCGGDQTEADLASKDKTRIRDLLHVMEVGVPGPTGMGALEWRWLPPQEAAARAKRLYGEAAHAQVVIQTFSPLTTLVIISMECHNNKL